MCLSERVSAGAALGSSHDALEFPAGQGVISPLCPALEGTSGPGEQLTRCGPFQPCPGWGSGMKWQPGGCRG